MSCLQLISDGPVRSCVYTDTHDFIYTHMHRDGQIKQIWPNVNSLFNYVTHSYFSILKQFLDSQVFLQWFLRAILRAIIKKGGLGVLHSSWLPFECPAKSSCKILMDILLKTTLAYQGTGQVYAMHSGTQEAGGTNPTDTIKWLH